MPGFLQHLACAERVWERYRHHLDYTKFMSGNIIPDLTEDKGVSHYRIPSDSGWRVPDMSIVERELLKPDSMRLGLYSHLAFDYFFFMEYLGKRFTYRGDSLTVTDRITGLVYPRDFFLSNHGLYGSYTLSNPGLIRDGYISKNVFTLPEYPPRTHIRRFDDRTRRNWLDEVRQHLREVDEISSSVFSVTDIKRAIDESATIISDKLSTLFPGS